MIRKISANGHRINREIGERIVDLRRDRDITQSTLAYLCDVTPASVSRWEKGNGMSVEMAACVAIAFNVSLDWLVLGRKRM